MFAKLQQQISDLWKAEKKVVTDVTEIKRVTGNIQQSVVKSDEHGKLADEVLEMKSVLSRLSAEQHAGNASHIDESNLTANVCKTLNDMNKRKKNVVVTGMPEATSGSSDSDETKRLDELAFSTFCEENLTVKPVLSKLGCRRLGKATSCDTKPRRLLVHLTSEQNAQDLLSPAKALLRKSQDNYIASTIYFNPDLTAAEAKLAFDQRQRRREDKIAQQSRDKTCGESATTQHGVTPTATTTVNQAATSIPATVPATAAALTHNNLSAETASFTTTNVSDTIRYDTIQ